MMHSEGGYDLICVTITRFSMSQAIYFAILISFLNRPQR